MTVQAYLQAKNKSGVCPINVRYFHNGVFFPVGVSHSVQPEQFDKKRQVVLPTHPLYQTINFKITLIKNRVIEVARELELKGVTPEREVVKQAFLQSLVEKPLPCLVNEVEASSQTSYPTHFTPLTVKRSMAKAEAKVFPDGLIENSHIKEPLLKNFKFKNLVEEWIETSTNLTQRTKTQRKSWLKLILEFSEKTGTTLSFDNFDLKFYDRYAKWLMHESDHNLFNNSFGNNVKRLKTFLNWCSLYKGIEANRQYKTFRVLTEEKQIEDAYLTRAELELLWEYKTYRESREKAFERVIDVCVFQNLTGLRFSDVIFKGGLKVISVNGQKVLTGKTKKSRYRQTYQIPLALDPRIEELLIKYNYTFHNVMSDVEYNRRIKEVLQEFYRKHGLHQKKYTIYRYKLEEQYIFHFHKHEMISSHSNRRGWVSWVYKELRLPEVMILKMMGSKSNAELKKYIALDTEDILLAVNNLNIKTFQKV
ncbi:phage integrase SAM-like domain-containing protein [Rufibacter latericius]|uniref:Uncharacterized protein n=1 Tax=Rufibacter latericius TaxID=2487040 RepID=A0A3M9MDD1_9BACT|nr:phage integrase SAM-like domain-containing protein [Rufibacter latericius]RNI22598.1 hypothetical protein EFB08_21115 [Rufibacter latericius]